MHVKPAAAAQGAGSEIWVVKIGGRLCETEAGRERFARACAGLGRPLVVVHGGGAGVSRLQRALHLEPRFVAGRRVTADEDLEVVEMALSGSANKALVRALAAAGVPAAGISGCDADLVRCDPVPGLGRVGTPARVSPRLVHLLLGAGITPVVSPVSLDGDGNALNVNADEVASALAYALGAANLLLLSDVDGVHVEQAPQREVAAAQVEDLVARGEVHGGMVPKLRAAAAAIARGVGRVHIAGFDGRPLPEVLGTRIVP